MEVWSCSHEAQKLLAMLYRPSPLFLCSPSPKLSVMYAQCAGEDGENYMSVQKTAGMHDKSKVRKRTHILRHVLLLM